MGPKQWRASVHRELKKDNTIASSSSRHVLDFSDCSCLSIAVGALGLLVAACFCGWHAPPTAGRSARALEVPYLSPGRAPSLRHGLTARRLRSLADGAPRTNSPHRPGSPQPLRLHPRSPACNWLWSHHRPREPCGSRGGRRVCATGARELGDVNRIPGADPCHGREAPGAGV